MRLTNEQLAALTTKKGVIASISAISEKKTPKAVGLGVIREYYEMKVQIGYDYESAVNRRLKKKGLEPNFKAQSLRWGQWVEGYFNYLITHKDSFYLRCYKYAKSNKKSVFFKEDGTRLQGEELQRFLKWAYPAKEILTQTEAGLDEDEQVEPFTVNLDNLISLSCGDLEITNSNLRSAV